MYTLNNIKEIKDEYLFEHVNCLEKPLGIVLNSYSEHYKSLFFMFLKMIQSYNFTEYEKLQLNEIRSMHRAKYILKKEFSIDLCCEDTNNIHEFIQESIDKNNPIMIVGNFRELFYSKFYKKEDWIHLFIIKGYNREKKIYYIMDSTQREDNGNCNYFNFVLPYYIIEDMYKSFNERIYREGIYYFNSNEVSININHKKMLDRCLELLEFGISEQPYYEINILNEILSKEKIKVSESEKLFEINNYKEVFYNELSKALSQYINDDLLYSKFEELRVQLLTSWKKADSKIVYYLYKNKKEEIATELEIAKINENEMRDLIKAIRCKLKKYAISHDDDKNSDIRFENNKDNVISSNDDGLLIFDFKNKKIYNNWFVDDSPKIVFSNIKPDEIVFKAKIKLLQYTKTSKFFAGLFLRTEDNSLYYWGINCALSIRLENSGIDSNMFDVPKCSDEVILQIKIVKNKCYFSYSLDDSRAMQTISKEIELSSNLREYGIGCKTWDKVERINFQVEQLDI